MVPSSYARLTRLALWALAVIVVTGATVRLTGSGLGCSDWPTCEQDSLIAPLEYHAMVEFVNRLITGLVAAAVVAAVLGSWFRRPRRVDLIVWSCGLVAGVAGQVVLGALLVKTELDPRFTMGHFLLSMVLLWNAAVLDIKARSDLLSAPPGEDLSTMPRIGSPAVSATVRRRSLRLGDSCTRLIRRSFQLDWTARLSSGAGDASLVCADSPTGADSRPSRADSRPSREAGSRSRVSANTARVSANTDSQADTGENGSGMSIDQVTRLMMWGVFAVGVILLVTGSLVTGSGPHAGDTRAERLPLLAREVARVHSITAIGLLALAVASWLRLRATCSNHARGFLRVTVLLVLQGIVGYTQYFTGLPVLLVGIHVALASCVWIEIVRATHPQTCRTHSEAHPFPADVMAAVGIPAPGSETATAACS